MAYYQVFLKLATTASKSRKNFMRFLFAFFIIVIVCQTSIAAERENLFDWYYSAVFGTGSYSIGNRDVFVVTVPYENQLRPASDDKYEILWQFPVTLGFYDYEWQDIGDLEIPTDVATLTVLPGIKYIIPVTNSWTIKPFANLGYGKEFDGGEEAWIYSAGVRSLYKIRQDQWRISFGSALYYAGNTRKDETDLGFAAFEAAIDINHATDWKLNEQQVYLGGYAAVYLFSNLEFVQSDDASLEVTDQYELGLTLSASKELTIMGVEMERIGLGYIYSKNLRAIRLMFSFPY